MRSSEIALLQIVQVTLLILVVGVITRLCCRSRPYLALALWSIVLLKCVLPPLLYSPVGLFCWMDSVAPERRQVARALQASVVDSAETANEVSKRSLAFGRQYPDADVPDGQDVSTGLSSLVRIGQVHGANSTWASICFAVWLVGAITLLSVYAIRCDLFLRRITRDREPGKSSDKVLAVEQVIQRLSRRIGLRRVPQLVLATSNIGPAVFGLRRPTVVLPAALVQPCTIRQLTPIVLHELIHIRRGDLWLALYCAVVRVVWWFHPLVWWSVRQMECESERCCDESVMARMRRDPARYAHSLINALEQSHQLTAISFVPGIRPVDITANRLERIMKLGHGSRSRMPLGGWVLAIVASALVLPGASGGLAQSPDANKATNDITGTAQTGQANAVATPTVLDPNVQQASHEVQLDRDQPELMAEPASSTVVTSYEVADLLAKLKRDEAWSEDTSDELLKRGLVTWLKQFAFPPATIESGANNDSVKVGNQTPVSLTSQTRFTWHGTQLIVSGPKAVHERLLREINTRRKLSFRQVTVEVRFMQGAAQLCRQTDLDAPAESGDEGPRWRNRWILFPQEFANESTDQLSQLGLSNTLDREAQLDVSNGPSAKVTTGKSDAIVYQFVDDGQFRSFLSDLDTDRNNTIMRAPKVTMFDGQMAEIADTSRQPFVTDVTKVVGEHGVAYQPVIKVLWEGTKIRLTPEVTADGHHLRCKLMFASIGECKTFRSPRYPEAKGVRIQRPVVTTTNIECEVDIPAGQTLLIGGLFPTAVQQDAEQGILSRLIGMRPAKIFSEQVMFIAITPRTVTPE